MTSTSRPARSAARLVAILAVALALAVAAPGVAVAGGPTSVLLASPATQSAAAMYVDDADYRQLTTLLGGDSLPTASAPDRPQAMSGSYVTATWLVHDVMVWRIDRIMVAGADDVWVVSESSFDGTVTGDGMYPGETGNSTAIWHRPTDAAALVALLAEYGLVAGADRFDGGTPIGGGDGSVAPAASDLTGVTAAAPAGESSWTPSGWLWGAIGLLLGIGGTAAVLYFGPFRRRAGRPSDQPPVPMIPV